MYVLEELRDFILQVRCLLTRHTKMGRRNLGISRPVQKQRNKRTNKTEWLLRSSIPDRRQQQQQQQQQQQHTHQNNLVCVYTSYTRQNTRCLYSKANVTILAIGSMPRWGKMMFCRLKRRDSVTACQWEVRAHFCRQHYESVMDKVKRKWAISSA